MNSQLSLSKIVYNGEQLEYKNISHKSILQKSVFLLQKQCTLSTEIIDQNTHIIPPII